LFGIVNVKYVLTSYVIVGTIVDNLLKSYISYESCKKLLKYSYFMPEKKVIFDDILLQREVFSQKIPGEILENFLKSLKLSDMNAVIKQVDLLTERMQNGKYTLEHCHQWLLKIISAYLQYVKELNLDNSVDFNKDLYKEFSDVKNIKQFKNWFTGIIGKTFAHLEKRNKQQNMDIIKIVKTYIAENLHNQLSLDILADKVSLSPAYLSTVFKMYTGINITDFILKQRMEKAVKLLYGYKLNVDQIAQKVGFSSSGYFIIKFKECFGMTPKKYQKEHVKNNLVHSQ
jgi:two-component system, response regulator YesN